MKKLNTPTHYLIANKIDTKTIINDILDSPYIKNLELTGSQLFDLGNILKYRIRVFKKEGQEDNDKVKMLDFEERLARSFNKTT